MDHKTNFTGCPKGEAVAFGSVVTLHYGENDLTPEQYQYLIDIGVIKANKINKEVKHGSD